MKSALLITRNPSNALKDMFTLKLLEIEQKHMEWFKNRPALFDGHKHDSLTNHTFSEQYGSTFTFIFWKHSELPPHIKTECVNAFAEVFDTDVFA